MEQHSQRFSFEIDKYSYLDFIFNCTDYNYDRRASEKVKQELYDIILPRLNKDEKSKVSFLIEGIAAESADCILRAIAAMDCVKIELTK